MNISPKAIAALLTPILAAVALWLITGDQTYLLGVLFGLLGGGGAVAAPPTPGVTQLQVQRLARKAQR